MLFRSGGVGGDGQGRRGEEGGGERRPGLEVKGGASAGERVVERRGHARRAAAGLEQGAASGFAGAREGNPVRGGCSGGPGTLLREEMAARGGNERKIGFRWGSWARLAGGLGAGSVGGWLAGLGPVRLPPPQNKFFCLLFFFAGISGHYKNRFFLHQANSRNFRTNRIG